ncbi:hypothetical protein AX17_001194 [Amanita inopinata Kibby_2008]|nr:hypothetical protein AX17_001194 [Amanita inopinata Kibby_2008]
MAHSPSPRSLFFLFAFFSLLPCLCAQSISTDFPAPPLQWIDLSHLLQSSNGPPPLKDAAIGYDENSRSIIVFGGESQGGFAQSQTYLLNLEKLTWSTPTPPGTLTQAPSARSASIAGTDFAASYRHGFVVIGGKGAQSQPLSDVWEYDFINQFWSQVMISSNPPSPRWGAVGGIDIRASPIQDPTLSSPNNTFYLAGGFNGSHPSPLSDVWRFNISGTLSSNMPDTSVGSWDRVTIGTLPSRVAQGGTVVFNQVVASGGCGSPPYDNISCAQQDSFVISVDHNSHIAPGPCPAPRYSSTLVPNLNTFSSSFASQVFVLSGLFNTSEWDDGGGSNNGEIAILDINAGTWTRVLPSGDPGTTGKPSFPVPREGAAAIAYPKGLVGQARDASSDIILYGGRDAAGNYLSDLWLLRSYNGSLSASSPNWPGFGNGKLESGINAGGSGVRVQFLTKCASLLSASHPTGTSPNNTSPGSGGHTPGVVYNTSVIHKILAPVSVALLLPTLFFFRLTSSTFTESRFQERLLPWQYSFAIIALVAYGLGIVGLAISFAVISSSPPSPSPILKTSHGRAGLVFFICLYGIVPALILLRRYFTHPPFSGDGKSDRSARRANSIDASEKLSSLPGPVQSASQSEPDTSAPSSPRARSHSLGFPSMRPKTAEGAMSSDTDSVASAGPQRTFEVLNRPPRNRHPSGNWPQAYTDTSPPPLTPRTLGDIDWLLRRRSLNAVDELDYAITQSHNARLETPATIDPLLNTPTSIRSDNLVRFPLFSDIVIHIFVHVSLLGICVVSLTALWLRAPKAAFAVFLAWTVIFYAAIFLFSWFGHPEKSVLSVLLNRLCGRTLDRSNIQHRPPGQDYQPPMHDSPYVHQPPYRAATHEEMAHVGPRSVTSDDEDDNIDEDTRQRMIEGEMERRDVSIVTVPRRRLWVANPS